MEIEQLSLLDSNQLEETKSSAKFSRERLQEIRESKKKKEPQTLESIVEGYEDMGHKVDESVGTIYTKYHWRNIAEEYHDTSLGSMTVEHLKQVYLKRQALRESKHDVRFFPSSLGRCKRMVTYQMQHYKATPKKGTNLLVLENGTSFHDRMESIFSDMGILLTPELSIKDEELCIQGRTDAVVWNFLDELDQPDPSKPIDPEEEKITLLNSKGDTVYIGPQERVLLVEFKSIRDNAFHNLAKSKPKKEHEMQLQLYFYLTGINKGVIYYENKDSQAYKEYIVVRNERIIEEVLRDVAKVVELSKRKELAEREYPLGDVHCRFCDYREICYPNAAPFRYEDLFKLPEEE